ncbi:MAG: hypothetical protein H6668_14250 [Ardenticatenaceae bacterium]|nr:hypothetical protein [Ardenticatenaceae bacterium]
MTITANEQYVRIASLDRSDLFLHNPKDQKLVLGSIDDGWQNGGTESRWKLLETEQPGQYRLKRQYTDLFLNVKNNNSVSLDLEHEAENTVWEITAYNHGILILCTIKNVGTSRYLTTFNSSLTVENFIVEDIYPELVYSWIIGPWNNVSLLREFSGNRHPRPYTGDPGLLT